MNKKIIVFDILIMLVVLLVVIPVVIAADVKEAKNNIQMSLDREIVVCYDVQEVGNRVDVGDEFTSETRYFYKSINEGGSVGYTAEPHQIDEKFTRYNLTTYFSYAVTGCEDSISNYCLSETEIPQLVDKASSNAIKYIERMNIVTTLILYIVAIVVCLIILSFHYTAITYVENKKAAKQNEASSGWKERRQPWK